MQTITYLSSFLQDVYTCCASDKIIKVCKNLLLTEMFPQKLGDVLRIFHMTTPFNSHRLCPLVHSTVYFTIIRNRENYPRLTRLTKSHLLPGDEDIVRASTEETGGWLL